MTRPLAPRSLAEVLRTWDEQAFTTLLKTRPDLCSPPPQSFADLVSRLTTTGSVQHALHRLNAWQRVIAEALAVLPDAVSAARVQEVLGSADELAVRRGLADLRARALLWGPDGELHLVVPLRAAFGPWPAGLADPSPHPISAEQIEQALADAGDVVRPLLNELVWGPPTGRVRNADRTVSVDTATTPVEVALAHGLLHPLDRDTVVMPREVARHLRGGRLVRDLPSPTPPPLGSGHRRKPELINRAGVGAAITLLRDLEQFASSLPDLDVRLLRDGSLSAKDLSAVASLLRLPSTRPGESHTYAVFVVELAWAAGLVNQVNGETLLATAALDQWLDRSAVDRWDALVQVWLSTPRWYAWGARPKAHALGGEADWRAAVELRLGLAALATEVSPGERLDPVRLAEGYAWQRPALAHQVDLPELTAQWWAEAGWLGLQALDAVTELMAVAAGEEAGPSPALADQFPEPVEELILQSDLTAVAPGPLQHEVGRVIRLFATQESRGAGGVFRFSATTLRRAFDAGWTADRVLGWLAEHSSTGVPQPLEYLVSDVARRHGRVRVGTVGAWVQTDDEAIVAQVLARPEAAVLGMRRLAPGVIVADADAEEVVALLHDLGLSPAAEDSQGHLLTSRPRVRARPRSTPTRQGLPAPEQISELAERIVSSLA